MPAFLSLSAYVCACFPMKFIVSLALNESERCNPTQSYNNDSKGQTTALRKRINSFQQQNTEHRRAAIYKAQYDAVDFFNDFDVQCIIVYKW